MDKCPNTCVTCLSNDRKLVPLLEMRNVLQYIEFTELKSVYGGICWECKNTIMKFYKFKRKTLQVQCNLSLKKDQNLKPLTNLGFKVNVPYNYHFNYDDPLNCEDDSKIGIHIKVEYVDDEESETGMSYEITEIDNNIKTEVGVPARTLEINPLPCLPDSHKDPEELSKEDPEAGSSKKFIKVIRTEKHMLKEREDLKEHPNYKNKLFMPFKCHFCVLGFATKESYDEHVQNSHDESIGPHVCHVCKVRFKSMLDLEAHRKIHYVYYKCRFCKYTTSEESVVLTHCKLLHEKDGEIKLNCLQCKKVLRNEYALEEHMMVHHDKKCNVCEMSFINRYSLTEHIAQTHKRAFICDICKHSFTAKSRIETHMAKHSAHIAKNMSYCSKCKVQFKSLAIYRHHLKTSVHHAEKNYSCPDCDKSFSSKEYCKQHYEFIHLRKSKYQCEPCDKLFQSAYRLKNHRQIHHGLTRIRNFACDECGKKFFTAKLVREHRQIHSENRSYMCAQCGDTFKQKAALYTHTRLKHKKVGKKRNK